MPATNALTAEIILKTSAALNNDQAMSVYNFDNQIPYINLALQELEEYFELHSVPVTEQTSAVIQVNAGDTTLTFAGAAGGRLQLPEDMIEPQELWERSRGIDPFVPMTKKDFLPHNLEGVQTSQLVFYAWQSSEIKFLASNQDNDVKIDYTKRLFLPVISKISPINVINAKTYLEYKTASLCAFFIGEDQSRSDRLAGLAELAIDRATGITVKAGQNMVTRRRPFRSAWKSRSYWTS